MAAAKSEQRSTAALAHDAIERYLRMKNRENLYAYGERQARKLGIRERDVPALVEQTRRKTPRAR
ncbi:MAG: hypothetical protein ABSH31_01540 [Bryobacteraceae bacterium]|jgi:hypothetical protein